MKGGDWLVSLGVAGCFVDGIKGKACHEAGPPEAHKHAAPETNNPLKTQF